MAGWGANRTIRADVLKKLLIGDAKQWGVDPSSAAVDLRGAVVTGNLGDFTARQMLFLQTRNCRFDGNVHFDHAQFASHGTFYAAIFSSDASFIGTTFVGDAVFDEATFAGDATFEYATFIGDPSFKKATITGKADFKYAAFIGESWFDEAKFGGEAWFEAAMFTRYARFDKTRFTRFTSFMYTIFAAGATFQRASFDDRVLFAGATFCPNVLFAAAKFNGDAYFHQALTSFWSLDQAKFAARDPGPWIGSDVSLNSVVLEAKSRIEITASTITARSLQAPEGAHLIVHRGRVDLSDSEFLRPSIVSGGTAQSAMFPRSEFFPDHVDAGRGATDTEGRAVPLDMLGQPFEVVLGPAQDTLALIEGRPATNGTASDGLSTPAPSGEVSAEPVRLTVVELRTHITAVCAAKANKLYDDLESQLSRVSGCRISSLEGSTVGELVLSGVVLDGCAFAGAHRLDEMRIGADCSFRRTRDHSSADAFTRRRIATSRRLLAEEVAWREKHTIGILDQTFVPGQTTRLPPAAADIAGIYRDLRKGLEDAKNEPEAADFYYGEMEMRRLAGRTGNDGADERRRRPSVMERVLLYGYWAVSGYGLRAWRATTLLIVLIAAAAFLFSRPGFATQATPERIQSISPSNGVVAYAAANKTPPDFVSALNFSARESVSLLHADSASVKTKGVGTLVDFLLRVAGPVLIAFIVLALRARTKR